MLLRSALLAIVCLGIVVSSAPAQSLKELILQSRKRWDAPTEPFRVIGSIHYVGTEGLASYLITGPQGHILIDTVMPGRTDRITANIEKLGFKLSDIKILINTHAHLDHTGGFAALKEVTGAQMIVGEKDRPLLESGTYPGAESAVELQFPPVKVDRTVTDGEAVDLGPLHLVARATPGHSPGCTTWTMTVTEGNASHGVIFFCSATVALNRLVGTPTYPGIIDDYKRTFALAKTIEGDVLLAPHPEMYGMEKKRANMGPGKPNPFVADGELKTYIAQLETRFANDLAKQQAPAK